MILITILSTFSLTFRCFPKQELYTLAHDRLTPHTRYLSPPLGTHTRRTRVLHAHPDRMRVGRRRRSADTPQYLAHRGRKVR